MNVREAKAGPELNAACARELGWIVDTDIEGDDIHSGIPPENQHLEYDKDGQYHIYGRGYEEHGSVLWCVRQYSSRIENAWELVEVMQNEDFIVRLWSLNGEGTSKMKAGSWEIAVWKAIDPVTGELHTWRQGHEWTELNYVARAETAPLAICRAFLSSRGNND